MLTKQEETRIRAIKAHMRRGTLHIIAAKSNCSYANVSSVISRLNHWNELIVKVGEMVIKLEDEDFAVELVRAKKKLQNEKRNKKKFYSIGNDNPKTIQDKTIKFV